MLSKNSSSSRAIPFKKMMKAVWSNPATPEFWGMNKAGMQAAVEATGFRLTLAKLAWKIASKVAVVTAFSLDKCGLHKQIVNRVVEPFSHITVVLSGTEFENFFALRAHKDAQPEFQVLAKLMLEKYNSSEPKNLQVGDWHMPFGEHMDKSFTLYEKLQVSAARCARTSYLTFDGEMNKAKDLDLFNKLALSNPPHMSPLEHVAQAIAEDEFVGNFRGFKQLRKTFINENQTDPRVKKQ